MNAEIIAVGSELLTPYRMDTNSLYLTEQLNLLGVTSCSKALWATISAAWWRPHSTACFAPTF